MLTTQRKISEQILRRLKKYSDDTDLDEREITLAVHQSLASIVRNRYFQSKVDETGEVDGSLYYTIKNLEVLKDDEGYYVEVPSSAIALPFGIDIAKLGSGGSSYIEVPLRFNDMYKGREASMLAGNIGFYRSGLNLYLVNVTSINNPTKLSITMLLPFSTLNEDDDMNLPSDMVDEVVEVVYKKFLTTLQFPTDNINDSKDN